MKAFALTGQFMSSVLHDSYSQPMPQNATKLDDCQISMIQAWIHQDLKKK